MNTQNPDNRFISYLPFRLLFLLSFLYFGIFAGHIFFYQEKTSLFVFSGDFLEENLQQPGGLLKYLSTFLTTFFYYPLAGAFIAAAILMLILIIVSGIVKSTTGRNADAFPFLIVVCLFLLQTSYRYLLINNLGLLLQVVFFYFAQKKLKEWIPVFLIPFWYYFTGGFALIFFVMYTLKLASEQKSRWWIKAGALWLIGLVFFYLSEKYLFFQTPKVLLLYPWSAEGTGIQTILFLLLAAAIAFLPALSLIRFKIHFKKKLSSNFVIISGSFLLVIIMAGISILKYDRKTLRYFEVERLFFSNRYQEVIDYNLRHPSGNTLTAYLNNVALCEAGKLNDLLLYFPQKADGSTLFLKWEIIGEILRQGGYSYYAAGMINEARRWAFEYLVMKGYNPENLKMVIKCEIISGNYRSAEKYIAILSRTLFYHAEAEHYKKLIFKDNAVENDPDLGPKRRIRLKQDFFTITDNPVINIERITATDSLNRKAFEYKLAYLLLGKDYKGIANDWVNLGRYDFKSIPVHVQEAGVAIRTLYTGYLPATGNLHISDNTEMQYTRFLKTFQSFGTDLKRAEPALRKQFGNTFWYYVFYR